MHHLFVKYSMESRRKDNLQRQSRNRKGKNKEMPMVTQKTRYYK